MYIDNMFKEDTFKNKVILITGGGTGLGKSMGIHLLELGAKIIITSRKMDKLSKTKDELNELYPNKIFAIDGDVRNIEDVEVKLEGLNVGRYRSTNPMSERGKI